MKKQWQYSLRWRLPSTRYGIGVYFTNFTFFTNFNFTYSIIPYYILRIILNFLSDRTFVVKEDGMFSTIYKITCGVPQGGVLSPTLFQIFINDIPMSLNEGELILLFADDIVFLKRFKYLLKNKLDPNAKKKVEEETQLYLNYLERWMNMWRLSLAPHKC